MRNQLRLSPAIEEYHLHRAGSGVARNTIKNDKSHLGRLLKVVGNIWVHDLTPRHFDAVFGDASATMSDASINALHSSLAAFLKWCTARGCLPRDSEPLYGRKYRKVAPKDRLLIPATKFSTLLDIAETQHPRDRALVACGLFLMGRQSELCSIRIGDLNLDAGRVRMQIHKTRQVDDMPIPTELDRELRTWLTIYTESVGGLSPTMLLLPSRVSHAMVRGEDGRYMRAEAKAGLRPHSPMSRPHTVVQRVLATAGYGSVRQEGCHTLRRSGARALFDELSQSGYDGALRTIQTFLHHSSSSMTEKYLGLTIDRQLRDTKFAGQPMFPSLIPDGNVVELVREG